MKRLPALLLAIFASGWSVLAQAAPATTNEGFVVPQPGHVFSFPRDHGSHPDFKIEWWYLTGHLFASDQRRFGFQATFFRYVAVYKESRQPSAPAGRDALYLAHMAVTDVKNGRFLNQERLNRDGWDAHAAENHLDVTNGPWSLRMPDAASQQMELRGGIRADAEFALTLSPEKPLVVFGENGVSRKGADPTAASYYLTFARLKTTGQLTLGMETFPITGQAWMDHEISSSQLGPDQVGWDWVSLQLNDHRELMLYRMRLADGSSDPASSLTWIDAVGKTQREPFRWTVLDTWTSSVTGAKYPSRIQLETTDPVTGQSAIFRLEPLVSNQELAGALGGVSYWEGACRVRDAHGTELGSAYVELTGYAKKMNL